MGERERAGIVANVVPDTRLFGLRLQEPPPSCDGSSQPPQMTVWVHHGRRLSLRKGRQGSAWPTGGRGRAAGLSGWLAFGKCWASRPVCR